MQSARKYVIKYLMRRLWAVIAVAVMLSSCTYAISKETRQTAVKDVAYTTVKGDIEKYKGSVVIFGGFIARTHMTPEETWLEIVQNPTDKYGNIVDNDASEGRFIAIYNGTLDPLIYEKGRLVTIAGELRGTQKGKIGQFEYEYPALIIKEIYLWREEVPYSAYYMPYQPYPWWYYDPWRSWYGPYWP